MSPFLYRLEGAAVDWVARVKKRCLEEWVVFMLWPFRSQNHLCIVDLQLTIDGAAGLLRIYSPWIVFVSIFEQYSRYMLLNLLSNADRAV